MAIESVPVEGLKRRVSHGEEQENRLCDKNGNYATELHIFQFSVTSGRTLYARDYLATREGDNLDTFQGNGATEPLGLNGASFQNLAPTTQQDACNAQFNTCVDAASTAKCQEQKAESAAVPDAVITGQVQGQAQNQMLMDSLSNKAKPLRMLNWPMVKMVRAKIASCRYGIAGAAGVSAAQNAASTGGAMAAGANVGAECAQAIATARRRRDVVTLPLNGFKGQKRYVGPVEWEGMGEVGALV
ncbi:uncharacterized protein BDCG_05088 [Blastomyces dermatitidis ER-3]|uniref:Uncharacterized protein n=1 Tax=Ajellomyces dermatitidis (strain ER-3 / ATCC MYA-2586) TaxID=559297 RepID=A0ABP2F021_AJEDR|nr:uncharacterized protein BDCG_05088 [Blastomyces dermatitidis ER-3]EEQ89968.2 hypothetical protein BDCG_05088 [Blastomyces dermatitidis ER-3]